MTEASNTTKNHNKKPENPGIWRVVQSILAGALGVQSEKRRREDLASHSPWPYLVVSVLFTLSFVVVLIFVVKIVLANH